MAPGLSGHQTGTVPKNKPKSTGFQSQRQSREPHVHSSSLDWDATSEERRKKKFAYNKSCILSEAEADSVKSGLGRSRSSTMTSQIDNPMDYSHNSLSSRVKASDHKHVVSKLSQIQSYLQQSADLMNAIKPSDTESNNAEIDEEELSRKSEESKKKLETLQKRKQDLLKLQEKAKQQLQEAQMEHSRLVAKASSLNQELSSSKMIDLSVQQLNQRLKSVHQIYNTRNQISENLNENQMARRNDEGDHLTDEEQCQEIPDTERDFQLVANKMEELNAMKAQLCEIQKIITSINLVQNGEIPLLSSLDSNDDLKNQTNHNFQNSSCSEEETTVDEPNCNLIKLEQAKCKLNHLTQLLDIVQTAQTTTGLSPPYLQLVSNLVNDEGGSSTPSPSLSGSVTSQRKNQDEISIETMQVMTRELKETTAAMKEERDKLEAARQELQNMARKLPLNKCRGGSVPLNGDSESEPSCTKPKSLDSSFRDILNGSVPTEDDQPSNCNDGGGIYQSKKHPSRSSRQHGIWNESKNDTVSRGSNPSSRGGTRNMARDSRWSPSPSTTYSNERPNPLAQTQNQLEMSSNLCETALSESGIHPCDISFQGMFHQHQLLTRTVAQCSQLLWIQQKQIIELRNALMLQNGGYPNLNFQPMISNQPQVNFPVINNSLYPGFSNGTNFSNGNQIFPVSILQQQQNCHSVNQNVKSNGRESHNSGLVSGQEFPEQFFHHGNHQGPVNFRIPDSPLECETRFGNFNRLNSPISNANQNLNQNISCGSNGRLPNGMNSGSGPEDSGALNNQVPPGNRANNYWDNFRSYSRQNLLSNTKSNEGTETTRRGFSTSGQDRQARDLPPPFQNNQSAAGISQQPAAFGHGNSDSADQFLLPPSQNVQQVNQQSQVSRSRPVAEAQGHRNPAKNETRHQDNQDSRGLISGRKNEASGGARARNPESCAEGIRSVRNDVSQSLRNADNLNSTRNFSQSHSVNQSSRDHGNEDLAQGINKKRLERSRCRKGGFDNLNNRDYYNTSLWENISSEVSNFIRTNEARPHFLIQLFRDMQQVTTDNLRQRTLESIQETVNANNLSQERQANSTGSGNVNLMENRNNIREGRSNLNRNHRGEDHGRIDELFCQLRENQNTIRENIGMSSFILGGNNLENPNISNIRDLINSRNNLENEGLRDLRTYFEANLCNFGDHHSTLENPNLSNIRENLSRREPAFSDYENVHPKNVYASVESRRRNLDSSPGISDLESPPFRSFEVGNGYPSGSHEYLVPDESGRAANNQFELAGSFEGAVGGRSHFLEESGPPSSRYLIPDGGDNLASSRQYLPNGNDSGIDINFSNEERKRSFAEGESAAGAAAAVDAAFKLKENGGLNDAANSNPLAMPHWPPNAARENSFKSSSFASISESSFFNCRNLQQSDNGDLAEADQSRNEEASGAESDGGFINSQMVGQPTETGHGSTDHCLHPSSESNFANQNVPESERNLAEPPRNCLSGQHDSNDAAGAEENIIFPDFPSEPEGYFRGNISPLDYGSGRNPTCGSGSNAFQSGTGKHCKREDSDGENPEARKSGDGGCGKALENSFAKPNATGSDEFENQISGEIHSPSASLAGEERLQSPSRAYVISGAERFRFENIPHWDGESGLDQVPTRLKKSGSSNQSYDSDGSDF